MQAGPKPAPVAKKRGAVTHTNVPQETFAAPAKALAEKLGWSGQPDWVGNDITVRDAQRYLQKVLHEAHHDGALGRPAPSPDAACEHLGVSDGSAIGAALALAHESGVGQATTSTETKNVSMDARAEGSAAAALGRMAAAVAKK